MTFARRWKGFKVAEVSERMTMIGKNRFKNKRDAKLHAQRMVEARGHWEVVKGKRTFIRKNSIQVDKVTAL